MLNAKHVPNGHLGEFLWIYFFPGAEDKERCLNGSLGKALKVAVLSRYMLICKQMVILKVVAWPLQSRI